MKRLKMFLPLALAALAGLPAHAARADERPNIVVILVDDAGFMDFGGFGGEARTPNIDRLAERGVRFSNFHASPLCAPSRAMLLTGLDSHKTGVGTLPEVLTPEQEGGDAYALRLLPGVETIADRLGKTNYETFMTGKWHLGRGPGDLPDSHGFDRSFVLDASGADNWEQKSFMPLYDEAPWFEDGKPATLPDDFYSSRFLVDKMIEYLDERDARNPFFAYIAFQAVHVPVQAPREFTDRYKDVYTDGWQAALERRFARAQELGLVPGDAVMPEIHSSLRKWEDLSREEQAHYERSMMVNAGMLEAMDHHIGRLIEHLGEGGNLDNTIFIIASDNGPEFNDPVTDASFRVWMKFNGYNADLETMGEKGSMNAIGPEWASAAAAPGSLFKMYASEGGTRVPLIVSGPGIEPQRFNEALTFMTDIAPTIAELAGAGASEIMDGRSLTPLLTGEAAELHGDDDPVGIEVAGNAALFRGRYKIARNTLPHGDVTWRLYDLKRDPSETRDLSKEEPELFRTLLADYDRYASKNGVIALPADFDVQKQISINARGKLLGRLVPYLLGVAGILGLAIFAGFRFMRDRRRRAT